MIKKSDFVISLDKVDKEDEGKIGIEAVRFGEMAKLGIRTPKGFVITSNSYKRFLLSLDKLTENLARQIFGAYKKLDSPLRDANVVVGSSYSKKKFSVKGEANLMQKIRSLWTHFEPAIYVYKIPDPSEYGLMFTIDPIYNDKKIIVINERNGNQYEVSKHDLKIVNQIIKKGTKQRLTDRQIIELAKWGRKLQEYYYFPQEVEFFFDRKGIYITKAKPITTTAIESLTDNWLQAGKKTTSPQNQILKKTTSTRKVLAKGIPIYPGVASGHLKIVRKPYDIHKLKTDDVAVITNTKNLELNKVIKKAKAIIIESSTHRLPYHVYVRKFGKPIIVTSLGLSKGLKEGLVATVNARVGEVYLWQHN